MRLSVWLVSRFNIPDFAFFLISLTFFFSLTSFSSLYLPIYDLIELSEDITDERTSLLVWTMVYRRL